VIGSGPTVPDPTTYDDALAVLDRCGGRAAFPPAAVAHLERGSRGGVPETPKPGEVALARAETVVIGSSVDALAGAREAAETLGYQVIVRTEPTVGEARVRASQDVADLQSITEQHAGRVCVLSAGETTVRITGGGRGGRNQEYALAASVGLASLGRPAALASIGTDGVDGPTDAAGAVADSTTSFRASQRGLHPMRYLDANDAWSFFDALGDLVRTGPTNTNVGDIQVTLVGERG
jgi:hydroxypyruvate reductase